MASILCSSMITSTRCVVKHATCEFPVFQKHRLSRACQAKGMTTAIHTKPYAWVFTPAINMKSCNSLMGISRIFGRQCVFFVFVRSTCIMLRNFCRRLKGYIFCRSTQNINKLIKRDWLRVVSSSAKDNTVMLLQQGALPLACESQRRHRMAENSRRPQVHLLSP